jgi:hypothetical protein
LKSAKEREREREGEREREISEMKKASLLRRAALKMKGLCQDLEAATTNNNIIGA